MTHSCEMKWLHCPLKGLISLSNSVKVGGTSAWKINTSWWNSDAVRLISVVMACFSNLIIFLELNVRLSKDSSWHLNSLKCHCAITRDSWEKSTVNQTMCDKKKTFSADEKKRFTWWFPFSQIQHLMFHRNRSVYRKTVKLCRRVISFETCAWKLNISTHVNWNQNTPLVVSWCLKNKGRKAGVYEFRDMVLKFSLTIS